MLSVFVLALFLFLLQNGTEDTALHSASQFGQSLVVAVLLEVPCGEKDELKKGVAFLISIHVVAYHKKKMFFIFSKEFSTS